MTDRMPDNGGFALPDSLRWKEPENTLLMATRGRQDDIEAEPVLIHVEGGKASLELDDGETVEFDLTELRTALGGHA